jgi:hypothetical protein
MASHGYVSPHTGFLGLLRGAYAGSRRGSGGSLALCFQAGEHVGPREQLRDRGCDIGKRLGWITDGLSGQRMMTTVGCSSVSTSSTVMVSMALIWPVARVVMVLIGTRF